MGKVASYRNDTTESVCALKLENGERIRIQVFYGPTLRFGSHHDYVPVGLRIDTLEWGGFRTGYTVFSFDIREDDDALRIARLPLAKRVEGQVSPLDQLLDYLIDCPSIADVKRKCEAIRTISVD
jgi:hypothetical protein